MLFEFDKRKSQSNFEKHGIDFLEIQKLWHGPVKEFCATNRGEPRWFIFGVIDGKVWIALITKRNGVTRIFSARRANSRERKKLYGEA